MNGDGSRRQEQTRGTLHEIDAPLALIGHAIILFDKLTIHFDAMAEEIAGEVWWVTSLNVAIQLRDLRKIGSLEEGTAGHTPRSKKSAGQSFFRIIK
jgi:hypothetical protein